MSAKNPRDLSVHELERLLASKRLAERRERLQQFRRSGRAVATIEEVETRDPSKTQPIRPARSLSARHVLDRLLLLVEVGAVVGLALVLISGAGALQRLNQEVTSALGRSTATPLITAVVLPSGHTPPTSPGGARPNEAEIPENLRPLVQSLPALVIPSPGPQQAIQIDLPTLGKAGVPVVEGDGWEQLKAGVGHHLGSANPGQSGNVVLSGHDDIFGEVFRDLDELKPGDEILLYTSNRTYRYVVLGWRLVAPMDVGVLAGGARPTLTLISCYPYMVDTQRIVVSAELQGG